MALGYLVGSGVAANVVKQIGFLLANDSANLPLSVRRALNINAGYSMGLDLVGLILGYAEGRNKIRNEKERLEAEFEKVNENEKPNIHELFDEGRRNYRDTLLRKIADMIAIETGRDAPANLLYDDMLFFEDRDLINTIVKIIDAGEKGNRG
jgi:hypothetical protein